MTEIFTISQIKERWAEYKTAKCWRVLREGKWKLYMNAPDTADGATRAEMVNLKDHIEFPKYLEIGNA